jgi:hypothetical protein
MLSLVSDVLMGLHCLELLCSKLSEKLSAKRIKLRGHTQSVRAEKG